MQQRKAVSLISGGLDSTLATKVILEQGVHVEGINFFTGFCVEGHTHAIRNRERTKPKRNNALFAAEQLGIKLHIIDVIEEYKDVVINPKHGYGANLNPCLDCKGFMVRKAREWATENGFDFIITGEVMGQRPMSQRKETMPIVAAESGADDRLLRPLCAKLLPETLPEREGWVNRDELHDFSGRSRKPQIALAKEFGIEEYAQPAGGCCFLTDPNYTQRLQDLWTNRGGKEYELDDLMLLKVGRHIRPNERFKMIIAREDGENKFMEGYRKQFIHAFSHSHLGAMALIEGYPTREDYPLIAQIIGRFGKGKEADTVGVTIVDKTGAATQVDAPPFGADEIPKAWYL